MAKLPDDKKKIKISISIDYESNKRLEELTQKDGFYKKCYFFHIADFKFDSFVFTKTSITCFDNSDTAVDSR